MGALPPSDDSRPRLAMLAETRDLALEVAGDVWPTPAMGLGSLFERGVVFLEAGAERPPIRGGAPADLLDALNRSRDELFAAEIQYAVAKYAAFALQQRSAELEATWLELADQHLATRAEIVACRGEEERLKRELAALGAPTIPLPEHEPYVEPPPQRPRKGREMYADLFAGATIVAPELDLPPGLLDRADRFAEAQGWATEWGSDARLVVFAHGLSLALREREADAIDPDDADSVRAAQARARERVMGLEGRNAALSLRLFELRHNARVLGWRITALRIEAEGMRHRLDLFGRDRARLEAQLAALQEAAARATVPEVGRSTGWRARLGRLFGTSDDA